MGGGGGGGLLSVRWPIVAQCSCQSEICGCKNESAKCTVFINIHGSSSSFAFYVYRDGVVAESVALMQER